MTLPAFVGDTGQIKAGPGFTLLADLGSTFPTSLLTPASSAVTSGKFTVAFDAAWQVMGFNETGGINFSFGREVAGKEVLQRLKPVLYFPTGETASVSLGYSQVNEATIEAAFAGGTWTGGTSGAPRMYTPPTPENQTRKMFCWISADEDEI